MIDLPKFELPKINPPDFFGKKQDGPRKAEWVPFGVIDSPAYLDNSLAGDRGFDPLGLVTMDGPWWPGIKSPEKRLMWMREAETKHGRLAMIAAAGWPLSELWHGPICGILNVQFQLEATQGRAPSLFNGNFDVAFPVWLFVLALTAYNDIRYIDNAHGLTKLGKTIAKNGEMTEYTYQPGDMEFDPASLYWFWGIQDPTRTECLTAEDPKVRLAWYRKTEKVMEEREIRNGRLAMMAIWGMAVQEIVYGVPVVDQSPFFFMNPIDFVAMVLQ